MKFVSMDEGERERYLEATTQRYAADVAKALGIPAADALGRSRKQMEEILPRGDRSNHHVQSFVKLVDCGPAGSLWIAERDGELYVFDIFIDEARRGEGLGTAALRGVEQLAREHGLAGVALSVFAHNEGAIRLYERLGYEVVETGKGGQRMRKAL